MRASSFSDPDQRLEAETKECLNFVYVLYLATCNLFNYSDNNTTYIREALVGEKKTKHL